METLRCSLRPDYLENAGYGRKWMAKLITSLASMECVAITPPDSDEGADRVAEAQKVVKEQTQKLLSACIAKEAAGMQKGCSSEDAVLGNASSKLILWFLEGFDNMEPSHLRHLDWLNPVLLTWCTRSKDESIQKSVHDLLEKTSPASPARASNEED